MMSSRLRGLLSSAVRQAALLLLVILISPSLAPAATSTPTPTPTPTTTPTPTPSPTNVIYVDCKGPKNGDGTSFKKAFRTIQAGIDAAANGKQLWVANGTYKERITLKSGVSLYGGYSGTTSDTVRNPARYRAIISSAGIVGISSGTVIMDNVTSTRLDGFTVTGASTFSPGGGVYCRSANNTNQILNCFITGNQPLYGTSAGIYCYGSAPSIANCVISANNGGTAGGGIVLAGSSSPTIMGCTIRLNTPYAIACGTGSSPQIVNTILANNSGTAVIALAANASPLMIHDLFYQNGLNYRGADGIPINGINTLNQTVTGSYGNVTGDPQLNNPADPLAFHIKNGSVALDRGLLSAAQSTDLEGNSRPGSDNKLDIGADEATSNWTPAKDRTPPFSAVGALPPVSIGPVLSLTTTASDDESGFAKLDIYYRRNGGPWEKYGTGFTSTPVAFGQVASDGDGYYEFYSRAVDIAGNVEPAPAQPDASTTLFLSAPGPRLYVNAAAQGANTGKTWADALSSLATALNVASLTNSVKEIWVASGTYTPAGAGGDRTASFVMRSGVSVYGGFSGSETSLSQRDPAANVTTLSGDLNGDDEQSAKPAAGDNSYHVVVASGVASGTTLDGFTISGGCAAGSGENANGGGIYINAGNPTLRNLKITGNQTADGPDTTSMSLINAGCGAGVYLTTGSQVKMLLCTVSGNRTGHGGRWIKSGLATIYGNGGNGAGLYLRKSTLTLTTSTVSDNVTGWGGSVLSNQALGHGGHGAGIYAEGGSKLAASAAEISSNATGAGVTVGSGNTYLGGDGGSGAGFYGTASAATFSMSQIVSNTAGAGADGLIGGAGGSGAGIYFAKGTSTLTLTTCTVNNNVNGDGGGSRALAGQGGSGAGILLAQSKATLAGCQVSANKTGRGGSNLQQATGASGGSGGGIFASTSTLGLTRCVLNQNQTGAGSDTISFAGMGGDGAGLRLIVTTTTLTNCVLAGNSTGQGGKVVASTRTGATSGGRGGNGGAIASNAAGLTLWYCTVAGNVAGAGGAKTSAKNSVKGADGLAGGIYFTTATQPAKKAASAAAGTQPAAKKVPTAQLADVILWGNREVTTQGQVAQFRGPFTAKYSDVQGTSGSLAGTGNINADPQFRAPDTLDLHLRATSPAVDTGSRLVGVTTVDLDGASRPYDGDGKGAVTGDKSDYDMGAYEYHGAKVGPLVSSVAKLDADPTSAASVGYQVTFSEPVTGVDKADFTLSVSGLSGAAISGVSGKGAVYTVTVATGSGKGTLQLRVKDSGTGIKNLSGKTLRDGLIGPAYTVKR